MQGVQPRIAAFKPAGAVEGCVHHDGGDVLGSEGPGLALDLDVAEAVCGVPGLEDVLRPAGRDSLVDLSGRQRRLGGEVEGPKVLC
ncbi:hypothetical protein J7I85_23985 [Arthrobacter sp. ISL-65]|nr:hypothetical protein [Arthrobacter sp. ISL-65]